MFHPTRGGTRGGKDQFKWDDVKTDKDRECYLGHSVMAPVGRWQQGKDLTWYAKDKNSKKKVKSEFQTAKDLEEKALMAALGYKVVDREEKSEENESSESDPEPVKKKSKRDRRDRSGSREKTKRAKVGPQTIDHGSKKDLDNILLKLVAKNGIENVLKALGDDGSSLGKHKNKKDKKHSKSKKDKSKNDSDESDSDSYEERAIEHKKSSSSHKKRSKKSSKKSSSESGDITSDSD